MFYLQFMGDFPSGRHGDPAVSLVEKASRRGVVCATALPQPMAGSLVQGPIPKCEAVSISCVQVHLFIQQMGMRSIDIPFRSLTVNRPSISPFNWNESDGVTCRLCVVDGSWSEWSPWEECTRSCGRGNRTRARTCTNPSAQHGGRPCEGSPVAVIMCNVRPCPGEHPPISTAFVS